MTGAVYTWNTIYENPEGSATYARPPGVDKSKLQAGADSQSRFTNYPSYKVWVYHDDSRGPHILPFSTYRSYTGPLAQRYMQYTRLNQMNDPFFLSVLRSKENLSLAPIGNDSNHLAFVEEKYKNRFEDLFKPGAIKPIALPVLGEEGYDTGHFIVSRFVKASNYSASYPALVPNPSTAAEPAHPKVSEENYSLFGMPANSSQPTVFQLLMYDDEYKDRAYSTVNTARGIGINTAHFDAIYANGYNSGVYQTNQKGLTLAYPLHMPAWSTTDISDAIKEAVKFGMSDKEKVPNADFFDKAFVGANRWDSAMSVKFYYYTKDAIAYYKNKVGPLFKYSEANAIKMYKETAPSPPRGAVFKRDNRLYLNGVRGGR